MRIALVCKICFEVEWHEGVRDREIWSPNHRKWHVCKTCKDV